MSAVTDARLEKCSVCKKKTASAFIAKRGLFSTVCRMCDSRAAEARKHRKKEGSSGVLGWILPALIFGIASIFYYDVKVPGADKVRDFIASLLDSKTGNGMGSLGPEKAAPERAERSASPAGGTFDPATQTLTMNLRSDVLFDFGDYSLKSAASGTLAEVAKVIHERPNSTVVVRGYTDSIGSEDANLALSRKRAESVRDWMVKRGIPAKRISVIGMGPKSPVAANSYPDGRDYPAGRAQNRRVTVSVTGT